MGLKILTIDDFDFREKSILLRVDINSPIDPVTKRIVNENRIDKNIPTIMDLANMGAKVVVIAHQGSTSDYHNLIPLKEHAEKLSKKMEREVQFIDDVAGPAAREKIRHLRPGEILLLDNIRYYTEEHSTFENDVKLTPEEMTQTYLVRNLAPLMDYYVNDAFAAAHRNAPSMVAFQELLPSAGGRLLINELKALSTVMDNPARPCVFVLGGLKISEAFGMMKHILSQGVADSVLTAGVTGQIMLMAQGKPLGEVSEKFIKDRSLDKFVPQAKEYLSAYPKKLYFPLDIAVDDNGTRRELSIQNLPADGIIIDIGEQTIVAYEGLLNQAGAIFVNGPPGIYEKEIGAKGTIRIWSCIADAPGFSVMGGGDTVSSANRLIDTNNIGFISTGGGALIRYLSGQKLPVLVALEKAANRFSKASTGRYHGVRRRKEKGEWHQQE
jgi:phosphoglycerate kinase